MDTPRSNIEERDKLLDQARILKRENAQLRERLSAVTKSQEAIEKRRQEQMDNSNAEYKRLTEQREQLRQQVETLRTAFSKAIGWVGHEPNGEQFPLMYEARTAMLEALSATQLKEQP